MNLWDAVLVRDKVPFGRPCLALYIIYIGDGPETFWRTYPNARWIAPGVYRPGVLSMN